MAPERRDEELATLVRQTSRGDRQALARLLERELPFLRAWLRLHCGRLVRRRESASDLVQSVCREVLQGIGNLEFRGEPAFRRWLVCVATNKVRQRERYYLAQKRRPDREVLEPASESADPALAECYASLLTPSRQAIAQEQIARLEAAFDRLSEDHRSVITWSRIVGLSHAEVGAEMGRSEGAVRILLSRALARLSTLVAEAPGSPTGGPGSAGAPQTHGA